MHLTEKLIQDLEDFSINGIPCPMIYVEGGSYKKGSMKHEDEQPIREVYVSSFFMAKYLMTQDLYKEIMNGENPSEFKGHRRPVTQVSWNHIKDDFLPAWHGHWGVQNLLRSTDAKVKFRLPSEAEWEFAAKGGIFSQAYKYAGSDSLKQIGWYYENSGNETKPVGQLTPNELGIQDMSGNVFEWCMDHFYRTHDNALVNGSDRKNDSDGSAFHVIHGGSFLSNAVRCRSAFRYFFNPEDTNHGVGFRLVVGPRWN